VQVNDWSVRPTRTTAVTTNTAVGRCISRSVTRKGTHPANVAHCCESTQTPRSADEMTSGCEAAHHWAREAASRASRRRSSEQYGSESRFVMSLRPRSLVFHAPASLPSVPICRKHPRHQSCAQTIGADLTVCYGRDHVTRRTSRQALLATR
jgi:hypothetical protein